MVTLTMEKYGSTPVLVGKITVEIQKVPDLIFLHTPVTYLVITQNLQCKTKLIQYTL